MLWQFYSVKISLIWNEWNGQKNLLAEYKFMPKMHLKQPEFTYIACESFTENKERIQKVNESFTENKEQIQKFKETGDSTYINKNKLEKACFQHVMGYVDFKDLPWKTASHKVLSDKGFNITKDPKYDECQRGLPSVVYKFFGKKSSGGGIKNENMLNQKLTEEWRKPIIRKYEKCQVYSLFKDNIWCADLADMQLRSKFTTGIRFLLLLIFLVNMHGLFHWKITIRHNN